MAKDEKNLRRLEEHDSGNVSGGYIHKNTGEEVKKIAEGTNPESDNSQMKPSGVDGDVDPAVMPPFNPFMLRKHEAKGMDKHFKHGKHGAMMPMPPVGSGDESK